MRSRLIGAVAAAGAIGAFLASQALDVNVTLGENRAEARSAAGPLWEEGSGEHTQPRPGSFAGLAEALSPAIVNIQTERTSEPRSGSPDLFEEFFRRRRPGEQPHRRHFRAQSTGSGFVISKTGYIVTNHHVIDGADRITVVFDDETKLEAEIAGTDSKTDLALIKVNADESLRVAPLGDSDSVRVGDWVMAIGNPFGLDHTVTVGILSARGRTIGAGPYDDFLQTDASINPGNSGGPLIDMKGRVIGINTAINAAGQGIGFAIPINMAKDLLPQLREKGSVTRGWLGVQIQRVTPALAESFGLEQPRGALISQVFDGSPAREAEMKRGDVIIEFDGGRIDDYDDLPRRVAATPPGTRVDVVVLRDGKRKTLKTVLEKMDSEDEPIQPTEPSGSDWGFEGEALSQSVARELGLPDDLEGVVIRAVAADGPAREAGLRRGDVILEVDRQPVGSTRKLDEALRDAGDKAILLIQRGEATLYVPIEKG